MIKYFIFYFILSIIVMLACFAGAIGCICFEAIIPAFIFVIIGIAFFLKAREYYYDYRFWKDDEDLWQ